MLRQFVERNIIPEPEYRTQVIQYIQRQKVNAICASRFAQAGELQQISQRLVQAIAAVNSEGHVGVRVYSLEDKLAETVERIKEFHKETLRIVKEESRRWEDKKYEIDKKHAQELALFEDKWNDEEWLRQFAKPSSHLLAVKKIERSLVLSKDFERAEAAKRQVMRLEKEESSMAQKRAESEMKRQQQRLLEKHAADGRVFVDMAEKAIVAIESERLLLLEGLLARQIKLQSELEVAKDMKTVLPPLKVGQGPADQVMTPRTAQRYAAYKTVVGRPKVTVRPLGLVNRKIVRRRKRFSVID
jgi:hypothetical protein